MQKKIAALTLAALFLLTAVAFAAVKITVKESAVITGGNITLGEIAEISGDEPERITLMRQINLGTAPLPLASSILSHEALTARLVGSQVDFTGVIWGELPAGIAITSAGQVVKGTTLIENAKNRLAARFFSTAQSEYVITILQEPLDQTLPVGQLTYSIPEQAIRMGVPQTVYLSVAINGIQHSRIPIKCELKRFEQVLTATANISPRQELAPQAVKLEKLDTSRLTDGYLKDPMQAVGLTASRMISAGSVIYATHLQKPVIIKRGTPVTIYAKFGKIEVTAAGLAQQDGREGQFIAVRNVASGRLLTGQVLDAGSVKIGN